MRPRRILLLLLALAFDPGVRAASKPNILFILCDDVGINDLGCYGRTDHRTPNLVRLASQGMRFTSAYCAQPICSPSRAAILTGKAPARLRLTTYLPGRPDAVSQKVLHPEMQMEVPLTDLGRDAGEARDVAAGHSGQVRRMRAALASWRRQMNAQENRPNPGFNPARFRELDVDVDASRFAPARADREQWEKMWLWRKRMDAVLLEGR